MNVSVNIILIISALWILSIVVSVLLTKRAQSVKPNVKSIGTPKDVKEPETELLLSMKAEPAPAAWTQPRYNKWELTVQGNVKFDIKVTWTDGTTYIYSGLAPKTYVVEKVPGVVPVSTEGIPPDWADDGISYQWYLNEIHWS